MQRLIGVDLVRILAALVVTIVHYFPTGLPSGWVGVQIFFVLSGYVIAASAQSGSAGDFVRSRFLRLFPGAVMKYGES